VVGEVYDIKGKSRKRILNNSVIHNIYLPSEAKTNLIYQEAMPILLMKEQGLVGYLPPRPIPWIQVHVPAKCRMIRPNSQDCLRYWDPPSTGIPEISKAADR
jgi:hypothetical protein